MSLLYSLGTDIIENTVSNSYCIVVYVSLAAETCLAGRSLVTDVFSSSAIPTVWRHVTIFATNVTHHHNELKYELSTILA
jgi:hypothetical protein